MLRRTSTLRFFEKQGQSANHPYTSIPEPHVLSWIPPFNFQGSIAGVVITLMFISYDQLFGAASLEAHPHSRWQYGTFGERVSYPANGTALSYNCPGVSSYGSFEHYLRGQNNPRFSPFHEDREVGKKEGGHGHH